MRVAVLHDFGQELEVGEAPPPSPGPGEVLVKVEACGVCHSDLHLAAGDWELLKPITKLPLILGHEIAGTVTALGEGVGDFAVGDRVGVPWLHWTCGRCEYCVAGRETLCPRQMITGVTVDGGFAEYVKAKASHTARLPGNLGFEAAAPLLCAGLTAHKALKTAGVRAGERVVIFGVGGLGHLAVQLAKARGLETGAVDVAEEKLELARACGADWTVNAGDGAAHKPVKARGGAHVAVVTSGSRAAYETALRSLRRGGTLAVVGMAPEPISVSTVALVAGETRIVASAVGTREDLREVLELGAAGEVSCRVQTRPFAEVNEVLAEMRRGNLLGRVALKI